MKQLLSIIFTTITILSIAQEPKNVIIVLGSGCGYNHLEALSNYKGEELQMYSFPNKTSIHTQPAISQKITDPKSLQNFDNHFHSSEAWLESSYIDSSKTDYASAGTAIATGFPTGSNCLGLSIDSTELSSILELMKANGKAFGIITNTAISNASSSAFFAKTEDATNKDTIIKQLLSNNIDLLISTNNPEFDSLGVARSDADFSAWGSKDNWDALIASTYNYIELNDDSDFTALDKSKQTRAISKSNLPESSTKKALDFLNNDSGFTAVFESRQIEFLSKQGKKQELIDELNRFNNMVDSIIHWVETNSTWDETAVIVAGTYESGLVTDTTYSPTKTNINALLEITSAPIQGELNFSINSTQNTNLLTPMFAKGAGTERIEYFTDHTDFYKGEFISIAEAGKFIQLLHKKLELKKPKNIILMIADGGGENQLKSAQYFYDYTPEYFNFPVNCFMSTYPGRNAEKNSISAYKLSYSSDRAWANKDFLFGYNNVTCSASSAAAIGTGKKTYYYGMGLDLNFNALNTIAQHAKKINKAAGVVSTMSFNNATPAAFGSHNISRKSYSQIGRELIIESTLDVIIGCGHPEYDNNNQLVESPSYGSFGNKSNWEALKTGQTTLPMASASGWTEVQDIDGDNLPDAWSLIDSNEDFIAQSQKATVKRLLGIPKVSETLQQKRSGDVQIVDEATMNNVPNLATLSLAGLNVLNQNSNGFYAMLEGGAIDQAGHGKQKGRTIEETYDFFIAVDSVIAWIERNGGWDENLLVVTADHETGLLTREPIANDTIWSRYEIKNNGAETMPDMYFNHGDHSNQLVPFFAKGAGSEVFDFYADEYDFYRGKYITNSEIGEAFHYLWDGMPGDIKNKPAVLVNRIETQKGTVGEPFSFIIPQEAFEDSDDEGDLSFEIKIPSTFEDWMQFNPETGEIYGTPTRKKSASFEVYAYDGATTGAAVYVKTQVYIKISNPETTNIEEKGSSDVYPNPVKSTQTVLVNSDKKIKSLSLISSLGQVVLTKEDGSNNIEVTGLAKGSYTLVIVTTEGTTTQPLIIQ